MRLQPAGKILDTVTRLHFSILASRSASSNDERYSLCLPTPLVKKILVGTNDNFNLPLYFLIVKVSFFRVGAKIEKAIENFSSFLSHLYFGLICTAKTGFQNDLVLISCKGFTDTHDENLS